jgi:hypothetical protein
MKYVMLLIYNNRRTLIIKKLNKKLNGNMLRLKMGGIGVI